MKRAALLLTVALLVAVTVPAGAKPADPAPVGPVLNAAEYGHWVNGRYWRLELTQVNLDCPAGTKPAVRLTDHTGYLSAVWNGYTDDNIMSAFLFAGFRYAGGAEAPDKTRLAPERLQGDTYIEYFGTEWGNFGPTTFTGAQPVANFKLVGPTGGELVNTWAYIAFDPAITQSLVGMLNARVTAWCAS